MKRLLITGAGSSAPYGFPTADKILAEFHNYLNIDKDHRTIKGLLARDHTSETIKNLQTSIEVIGKHIKSTRHTTIDRVINQFDKMNDRNTVALAKAIMLDIIIKYERQYTNPYVPHPRDWLDNIFETCGEIDEQKYLLENYKFITFNYDRMIEYYIYDLLKNTLHIDQASCIEYLNTLDVIHIHGIASHFHIIDEGSNFGDESIVMNFANHIDNVNIMTSEFSDQMSNKIKNNIEWADQVIFLGLGYHEINLRKLHIENKNLWGCKDIYGTSYELVERDVERTKKLFDCSKYIDKVGRNVTSPNKTIKLYNMTCEEMLRIIL